MLVIQRTYIRKSERADAYFVSSATKLCNDICGQESRIASRHIYIQIVAVQKSIQYSFKALNQLYLVQ